MKHYVACPQCGRGLARNWLKVRDPVWRYCKDPDCMANVARIRAQKPTPIPAMGEGRL